MIESNPVETGPATQETHLNQHEENLLKKHFGHHPLSPKHFWRTLQNNWNWFEETLFTASLNFQISSGPQGHVETFYDLVSFFLFTSLMSFIMLNILETETTVTYVTCTHQVKRGALFDSSHPPRKLVLSCRFPTRTTRTDTTVPPRCIHIITTVSSSALLLYMWVLFGVVSCFKCKHAVNM